MRISPAEAKKQFNRAKKLGWLPHFRYAAEHITKGYFDAADLMGIASRETNLDPKWLTTAGDRGNGYGLMQADVRSYPEWIKSGKWRDAREGIIKGAEVLMQKLRDTQDSIGKRRSVKSSKTGKLSHFTGKDVRGVELQQVTIAAYNAGRWGHYAVSTGKHVDLYTTGKDYSSDGMARAAEFRKLLKEENKDSAAPATNEQRDSLPDPSNLLSENPQAGPPMDQPEEIKATSTTADGTQSVEVTAKNEQSVNQVVKTPEPEPYRGVGFWKSIKMDLAAATGGNFSFELLNQYAQQASGWPEWIIAWIGKIAFGAVLVTIGYFIFRVVHYAVDRWQQNQRTRLLAEINSDKNRKDIELVPKGDYTGATE